MSKETLEYHHDIHHKAYVDNLNKLIAGTDWEGKSLGGHRHRHLPVRRRGAERHLQQCQPALEPLAVLGDDGPGKRRHPRRAGKGADRSFGSVAKFKEDFAAAGASQFGSGLGLARQDKDGSPSRSPDRNGVNPLCFGQTALLGCDVWGTQLLYRLPQQAAGLPDQLPRKAGELGKRGLAPLTPSRNHRKARHRAAFCHSFMPKYPGGRAARRGSAPLVLPRDPPHGLRTTGNRHERMDQGFWAMIAVCVTWGLSPIFYHALAGVPVLEVLAHRTIWSLVFFLIVLGVQRRLSELLPAPSPGPGQGGWRRRRCLSRPIGASSSGRCRPAMSCKARSTIILSADCRPAGRCNLS